MFFQAAAYCFIFLTTFSSKCAIVVSPMNESAYPVILLHSRHQVNKYRGFLIIYSSRNPALLLCQHSLAEVGGVGLIGADIAVYCKYGTTHSVLSTTFC